MAQDAKTTIVGIVVLTIVWAVLYVTTPYVGGLFASLAEGIDGATRAGGRVTFLYPYIYYGLIAAPAAFAAFALAESFSLSGKLADDTGRGGARARAGAVVAIVFSAISLAFIAYALVAPWRVRNDAPIHVPQSTPHTLIFFGTTLVVTAFCWWATRPAGARETPSVETQIRRERVRRVVKMVLLTPVVAVGMALVVSPIALYLTIGSDHVGPVASYGMAGVAGLVSGWLLAEMALEESRYEARHPGRSAILAREGAIACGLSLLALLPLGWLIFWSDGYRETGYRVPDELSYSLVFLGTIAVVLAGMAMRRRAPTPAPA